MVLDAAFFSQESNQQKKVNKKIAESILSKKYS